MFQFDTLEFNLRQDHSYKLYKFMNHHQQKPEGDQKLLQNFEKQPITQQELFVFHGCPPFLRRAPLLKPQASHHAINQKAKSKPSSIQI
jgi:hypothetical protein